MATRASLVRLGVVAASTAVVGLAACDGPNRFTGPGLPGGGSAAGAPTVEIVNVRSSVPIGDSVLVEASAADGSGVVSMTFVGRTLRGDPAVGTDESVTRFESKTVELSAQPGDTTLARYLKPVAGDDTRETTYVVVEATDADGNVGVDSVAVVVGGPAVEFQNLGNAQAGTDLPLRVLASDPAGISSVRIDVTGALDTVFTSEFGSAPDTADFEALLFIPEGTTGSLDVEATAVNISRLEGSTGVRRVTISAAGATDGTPPALSVTSTSDERLELTGQITVTLQGQDNSGGTGIRTAGLTVLAISPTRGDTVVQESRVSYDRARSGTVAQQISFEPFNVDPLSIPDTLIFEITGFFVDDAGNCAAAVSGSDASLECGNLTVGGSTGTVADGVPGLRVEREIVAGTTVFLPTGGQIMDATVDPSRRLLFLSNIDGDRVEVFDLDDDVFNASVPVGSEPWGMTINTCYPDNPTPGCGDTLIVANSGGTNLSKVYLGAADGSGPIAEDAQARILTPDQVLYNVTADDENAVYRYTVLDDWSDRPQFTAVDVSRRIHYSTRPTALGDIGTLRRAFVPDQLPPGAPAGAEPQQEVKMVVEHVKDNLPILEDVFAMAHVDSVLFFPAENAGIYDHVLGLPSEKITPANTPRLPYSGNLANDVQPLVDAGSDILVLPTQWDVGLLGFEDTTFVEASGDGKFVLFGEGGLGEGGRILMYDALGDAYTPGVPIADLITNASDAVRGLGINYDGSLGVARGNDVAYFFTEDLRLQGVADATAGGAGAVLHPLHANSGSLFNPGGEYRPDTHLAFIGTGENTIDIYDTFHFFRSGRIFIRDVIAGPLQAALPFPGDNEAGACPATVEVTDRYGNVIGEALEIFQNGDFNAPWPADGGAGGNPDTCVVLKLFGITTAGGVVTVDVTKGDILLEHPARN